MSVTDGIQDEPLVSVVMSFHNARDTLLHAIRSLLWQTYPHWELILLDDGSNDGSAELAKAVEDPRIRLYGDSLCRGLPVRLNQGVSLARGQYLARMDADDVAFPERFAKQVAYLQNHPEVDLLATAALLVNANDQAIGLLTAAQSHEEICRRPWHGFPMPHPTWMGHAEWFRQNLYDEGALKAQDQELLYRTYRKSNFAGLSDALLGYRCGKISMQKSLSGRGTYLRAIYASKKHPNRVGLFLRSVFFHSAALIRDGIAHVLSKDSEVLENRGSKAAENLIKEWRSLVSRLAVLKD